MAVPITRTELILFNNVESTDIAIGALQAPFFKSAPYIPNITYVNGFEKYIAGGEGGGSQVLIRTVGKGTVKSVKANVANAFDYTHLNTADTIEIVQLDDVVSMSEKIYEAVDVARHSAQGARKVEVVVDAVLEKQQELISGYLHTIANKGTALALTKTNIKDAIADAIAKNLDYVPTTIAVPRATYALMMQLVSDGTYTPIHGFDTVRTGVVGMFLGLNVIVDENLPATAGFIVYDHKQFAVFPTLEKISIVQAIDFDGSYARALGLLGAYKKVRAKGAGAWAFEHVVPAS